jgi:hypothetical protein
MGGVNEQWSQKIDPWIIHSLSEVQTEEQLIPALVNISPMDGFNLAEFVDVLGGIPPIYAIQATPDQLKNLAAREEVLKIEASHPSSGDWD